MGNGLLTQWIGASASALQCRRMRVICLVEGCECVLCRACVAIYSYSDWKKGSTDGSVVASQPIAVMQVR